MMKMMKYFVVLLMVLTCYQVTAEEIECYFDICDTKILLYCNKDEQRCNFCICEHQPVIPECLEICPKIYCPAGEQTIALSCTSCPDDTFKPKPGYDTCSPCKGHVTSDSKRLTCDVPFCDIGAEPKNGECSTCTKGFYKSERGNTTCKKCSANFTTPGMGAKSSSECDQLFCEPGFFAKEQTCEPCIVGTYNDVKGQTECKNCSSDRTTPSTGSTSESQCSLAFCDIGAEPRNGECSNCTKGFYKTERGNTACKKCPANFTTSGMGAKSSSECDQHFCEPGLFAKEQTCEPCIVGSYNDVKGQTECKNCSSDRTTPSTGSTSESQCSLVICPIGEYRKVTDRDVCTPCIKNSYQDQTGQTVCKPCKQGEVTENIKSTKSTDCLPNCKPGEYLDKVARSCKQCPLGEYSTTGGLNTKCTKCTTGKTTTKTGSTSSSDCNFGSGSEGIGVGGGIGIGLGIAVVLAVLIVVAVVICQYHRGKRTKSDAMYASYDNRIFEDDTDAYQELHQYAIPDRDGTNVGSNDGNIDDIRPYTTFTRPENDNMDIQ